MRYGSSSRRWIGVEMEAEGVELDEEGRVRKERERVPSHLLRRSRCRRNDAGVPTADREGAGIQVSPFKEPAISTTALASDFSP